MSASKKKSTLIAVLVVLLLALLIGWLLYTRPSPPVRPPEDSRPLIDTQILQPATVTPELEVIGTVVSSGLARIVSRVTATVETTLRLAGNRVREGELLLQLDPVDTRAALAQRKAELLELRARLAEEKLRYANDQAALKTEQTLVRLAETSLGRQKKLVENKVTSQERLEAAEITLENQRLGLAARELAVKNHVNRVAQLEAGLERAQAQLLVAEADLAQTSLAAPFAGWITEVSVAQGSRVRPGEPLLEILREDSLEVRAQIPERDVEILRNALAAGQHPEARSSIFGKPVRLRLERLAARVSDRTAGIDGWFSSEQTALFVLGKNLTLDIALPPVEKAWSVPVQALYSNNRIYVVREEAMQVIDVRRTGRFRDAENREHVILEAPGLAAGDAVVLTQLPNAVTGLKVRARAVDPAAETRSAEPLLTPET